MRRAGRAHNAGARMGVWRQALAQRLDRQLEAIEERLGPHPELGWIRMIREALGITGHELGVRLGVSRQRVDRIEQQEVDGTIPLSTLMRVAAALDCRVRYVLVPDLPLEVMLLRAANGEPVEAPGMTFRGQGWAPEEGSPEEAP